MAQDEKRPKVDEVEIPVVSDSAMKKILDACQGQGFEERRDTALILFLLDTGARASPRLSASSSKT